MAPGAVHLRQTPPEKTPFAGLVLGVVALIVLAGSIISTKVYNIPEQAFEGVSVVSASHTAREQRQVGTSLCLCRVGTLAYSGAVSRYLAVETRTAERW